MRALRSVYPIFSASLVLVSLTGIAVSETTPSTLPAAPVDASLGVRSPLIATGWDSPTTRKFRDGLAKFEQWGIFDGTTLRAERVMPDGKLQSGSFAFSRQAWRWEEFAEPLADLKAAKPASCRENFLMLYSNPGDVDWFDDEGWKVVTEHWRLLSRLAKQGGLRGLLFDAEPYTPPHSQFLYGAQPQAGQHSFSEYQVMARQRGREVMKAASAEFPEMMIFSYRLFSDMLGLLDSGELSQALEAHTYGLLPSFVDGWLDEMPLAMRVVEGTEDIGYRANSPDAYNAAFTRLKLRMPEFVRPEHREKLVRQFRVGQSLYLDAYANPPGDPWHIDSTGSTPTARLRANVASALAASDGIVWIYGEKANWWPSGNAKYPTWPDRLPGALAALRYAKDPMSFARELAHRNPPLKNLLANGDFSDAPASDGPPKGWFQWQEEGSHGKVCSVDGQVELSRMRHGVIGMTIPVKEGSAYVLRLRMKSEGKGRGFLSVGWKNAEGAWTAHSQNRKFMPVGSADEKDWSDIIGILEVPPSAGQLVFLVTATGQESERDLCRFDDAALMLVPESLK